MAVENISDSIAMDSGKAIDFSSMKDSIQLRHGNYFILLSLLFFQFVNWCLKSHGPPKSLKDDEWKWRNLWVSWFHALITSVWVLTSFYRFPEVFADVILHVNYYTFFCACFATGYFTYDLLDVVINNKARAMWEVVIHHIMVAGMLYYNVYLKAQIGFSLIAMTVEVNSIFLHWRKLYQMTQVPFSSFKYAVVKYLNLVSFALFRLFPLAYITYTLFTMYHRVSLVYYVLIFVTMACMDLLNAVLFWRLVKSDILRGWASRGGTSARHSSSNGTGRHKSSPGLSHSNGNNNSISQNVATSPKKHA
ncbi:TLC domain-containing protein 2-like [Elysia marginata]|uniref:TLC domain-containing protein 2-like n=1 Tax=Elysia marginata TaxID=1093978 RepID=A0AAV4FHN5_9GAST|nr:TLC domain-containing protein 2-like [Elysia marginata]